jgi:uncharacterized membrane protein YfcA
MNPEEDTQSMILLLFMGIAAGILSGLFGIGGGVVLVPAMVYGLKFSQKTASGVSLAAMLLPVGALGVYQYFKSGLITGEHLKFSLWIALGMFIGATFGAKWAVLLPIRILQKGFALLLVFAAVRLWMQSSE